LTEVRLSEIRAQWSFLAVPPQPTTLDEVSELIVTAVAGTTPEPITVGLSIRADHSPVWVAFRDRKTLNLAELTLIDNEVSLGPAIIAPLRDTRVIAGALVVGRSTHPNRFSDEERDLVTSYADHAAVALQYSITQQRILELERRDRDTLEREEARARREDDLVRRERLADERDRVADERDQIANHREQMADEREIRADEREGTAGTAAKRERERARTLREQADIRREIAESVRRGADDQSSHSDPDSAAEAP
jgi:GAF domain-containing protein